MLSLYYAHTGRAELAYDTAARAVDASSGDALALYFPALALCEIEAETSQVFDTLEAAVADNTQYRQIIADDPDLEALGNQPRYLALINGAE